ncbi:OCIA domain-containing protein asrij isoform X2 [Dermatophagoides pteronyssinus]|uniref:OCIA domain-containing protein asrij isoform X2 n=1 Tax=Dermatophagoides pteronyssinus TaxID=6956 RepID=UPI003F667989
MNNPYENSSHQNRDGHFDRINDPYGTSQNLGMQPNVQPPDQYQQQQQFIQQRPLGPKNNQMIAKNYNDFLERQGVPAISPEDIKILRECSRESLVYRCFPITAALCTALMYTARTRQIQPRFYHYLGTIFFGYFAGKLSYRSVCEDKLIKSNSNSPFVQSIRKQFDPNMPQAFESSSAQPSTSFGKPYAGNIGSSTGIREFDDHDSSFNRSKDSYIHDPFHDQKSSDFSTDIGDDNSSSGGNTSYENLRARNRSAFKNM